jgi:putative acetyltransferase
MVLQIRPFLNSDMNRILDIWLEASIIAHPFISARIWKENLYPMRNLYLPTSEITVACKEEKIIGFMAMVDNQIAALFVEPFHQNLGVGKSLLNVAKKKYDSLTLKVFQKNTQALNFYGLQGFQIQNSHLDEYFKEFEYVMNWDKNLQFGMTKLTTDKIHLN